MAYADNAGTATIWLARIDAALAKEGKWRERAKKVIRRYRDERQRNASDSKINILWANTEVLKASLWARMPKPDVRRRFPDAAKQNSASRIAAEAIERTITYVNDIEKVDQSVSAAIDDVLLPGRGVCWWSYEPEIEEADETGTADAGSVDDTSGVGSGIPAQEPAGKDSDQEYGVENDSAEPATGRVVSQTLCLDYVYWEDYCQGVARQDRDVPWKARRHVMRGDEFDAKFPAAKSSSGALYELKDADDHSEVGNGEDRATGFIEVWEIWDKAGGRKRIYVGRGYPDILQSDDDPYQLSSFFPSPKPLYSVTTTDKTEPIPEFLQYQDQALELDRVSTRITRLIEQLKFRGVYDASVDGENVLANLPQADDGEFLPYRNWMKLKEKGGIENAVGFWPIAVLVDALQQLYVQRNTLVQAIYEITGISDIVRGQTDPNETKGAQVLKAQFGSMRMQRRQREISRFVRDLYAIGGEIIAEHFTQETLADITAFDLPTRIEQQQLQAQVQQQQAALPPPSPMGPAGVPMDVPPGPPSAGAPQPPLAPPPVAGQPFQEGAPIPRGGMPTLRAPASSIDPEVYAKINGPCWEDVLEILRSDKLRGYRVDIETDTSIMDDATQTQQERESFMAFFQKGLEAAYLAAVQAPMMLPLIKESFLYGIRTFKAGRPLEQAVEDAFDELAARPPTPPSDGKGNDDAAAQAQIEAKKGELALKMKELQSNHDIATKKIIADASNTSAKIQADLAGKQADAAVESKKLDAEQSRTNADIGLRVAAHNKTMVENIDDVSPDTGAPADPLPGMMGMMQQMVTALGQQQQGLQAIVTGLAQVATGQQHIAQQNAALMAGVGELRTVMAAPTDLIRDPVTGKAVGARKVLPAGPMLQ